MKIVRAIAEMTIVQMGTVAVMADGNMAIVLIIHRNNRKGGNQISINCEPLKSHCAGLVSWADCTAGSQTKLLAKLPNETMLNGNQDLKFAFVRIKALSTTMPCAIIDRVKK